MKQHHFIFQPGNWIGEGKVTFSASPEELHFYTKWTIKKNKDHGIECEQTVEMQGTNEHVINHFLLTDIHQGAFSIFLENDLIGKIQGKGVVDEATIGWEFRGNSGLEGFETFQLQENGEYLVHAEYASQDQFRSIINGKIWLKSEMTSL